MKDSFGLTGAICAMMATAFFCQAQTRTVVLSPPPPLGTSTNVVINVASNEVFELLYVNWPGEQAGGQLCPPFVEVAIGEFRRTTTEIGEERFRLPMDDRALHAWVMFGGRLVTNP